MSKYKWLYVLLAVAMLVALLPASAGAAPAAQAQAMACAKDYTVSAGDSLSTIAEKEYGAVTAYWPIMAATNAKNLTDSTYARIENPDLIEPGWKLCVPSTTDAEAFLAAFPGPSTPAGVAMLFGKGAEGQIIVASWWTNGGEFAGLNEMFKIYKEQNPGVEIVNAAVAGGAGTNFKGQLLSQLLGGAAPDVFQLHAGWEADTYNPGVLITDVDNIYTTENLESRLPPTLLTMLKFKDHYWGVPVNIHRSNVLWYNKALFAQAGIAEPPKTWDEFFAAADKLKAAGIQPIALGGKDGFELQHTFEDILAGSMTAEEYAGLWTGKTSWNSPKVTAALETFKKYLSYSNADNAALTWAAATQLLIDGKAAMNIMGDWANGQFISANFTDYGWAPVPGTDGTFVALSDSFGYPTNAPNKDAAQKWFKTLTSAAAQEAFNKQKGSICAVTDCDYSTGFNTYLQSAAEDWKVDAIVPSVTHGAAATPSWATKGYADPIVLFATNGDVAAAQAALVQAAIDAGFPQP